MVITFSRVKINHGWFGKFVMSTKTSTSSEEIVLKRSIGNNIEHCHGIRVFMYSKSMDQPGKVANPARGQLNREN